MTLQKFFKSKNFSIDFFQDWSKDWSKDWSTINAIVLDLQNLGHQEWCIFNPKFKIETSGF